MASKMFHLRADTQNVGSFNRKPAGCSCDKNCKQLHFNANNHPDYLNIDANDFHRICKHKGKYVIAC